MNSEQDVFSKLDASALKAVMIAQSEVRRYGTGRIGTEQLLIGLLAEGEGEAAKSLTRAGMTVSAARAALEQLLEYTEKNSEPTLRVRELFNVFQRYDLSPKLAKLFERLAQDVALAGLNQIDTTHLLTEILQEEQCNAV